MLVKGWLSGWQVKLTLISTQSPPALAWKANIEACMQIADGWLLFTVRTSVNEGVLLMWWNPTSEIQIYAHQCADCSRKSLIALHHTNFPQPSLISGQAWWGLQVLPLWKDTWFSSTQKDKLSIWSCIWLLSFISDKLGAFVCVSLLGAFVDAKVSEVFLVFFDVLWSTLLDRLGWLSVRCMKDQVFHVQDLNSTVYLGFVALLHPGATRFWTSCFYIEVVCTSCLILDPFFR